MMRLADIWQVAHEEYRARIETLREDLTRLWDEGLPLLDEAQRTPNEVRGGKVAPKARASGA